MNNKICVIFTGGTIGSAKSNGIVNLSDKSSGLLINKYKALTNNEKESKIATKNVIFDEKYPLSILSENIQKEDLYKIVEAIKSLDITKYDGIILTHGTDTMCFTANYLSQVLCDIQIPLVLVSSLFPLTDKKENGTINFSTAVNFIYQKHLKGVYVSFKNEEENAKIYLASRVRDISMQGKLFTTPNGCLGEIINGNFEVYDSFPISEMQFIDNHTKPYDSYLLCDDVLTINARALTNFSLFDFSIKKPKAVLLELYHSGTVCTVGDNCSFVRFFDYLDKLNIPVILAPINSNANVYASFKSISEKCIFAYDVSFEIAVIKTMLLLSNGLNLKDNINKENKFFEKLSQTSF